MGKRRTVRARELALYALLGAVIFAAKMALAALPNIEPVSLMVMLCAVTLGRRALFPVFTYVGLEILVWGIGLWNVNYIYIWPILAGAAWLLRDMSSPLGWALLSGAFGLCFGALCTPVYLVTGGWAYAVSWWVSGIPFDLIHCAGNFVIALLLFCPLRELLARLTARYGAN